MDNENVQNTGTADAIPQETEQNQAEAADNTESGTPAEESPAEETAQTDDNSSEASADVTESELPFLSVQFNHETRNLDEKEAKEWAERGMHYFNELNRIATLSDVTVPDLLKKMKSSLDDAERQRLVDKYGEDDTESIEMGMRDYIRRQDEKLNAANIKRQEEEKTTNATREAQIAEDYLALKNLIPDVESIDKLPKEVLKMVKNGRDLVSAYLLNKEIENQRIIAANKKENEAAKSSTGSLHTNENSKTDLGDEFAKGVWGGI